MTDTRGPRRSPASRADWPRAAHSCATPLRRGLPRWAPHPLRLGGGPRVTSETGPSCPAPRGWGGHWCGPATGRARCGWARAPAASGRGRRAGPAAGRPGCCGGVEAGQRREAPVPVHVCRGSGCSEGAPRGRQQAHSWAEGPPPAWPCRALPALTWTRCWARKTSSASRRGGPGWSPARGCSGWGPGPGLPSQLQPAAAPRGSGAGEAGTLGVLLAPGQPLQGWRGLRVVARIHRAALPSPWLSSYAPPRCSKRDPPLWDPMPSRPCPTPAPFRKPPWTASLARSPPRPTFAPGAMSAPDLLRLFSPRPAVPLPYRPGRCPGQGGTPSGHLPPASVGLVNRALDLQTRALPPSSQKGQRLWPDSPLAPTSAQ